MLIPLRPPFPAVPHHQRARGQRAGPVGRRGLGRNNCQPVAEELTDPADGHAPTPPGDGLQPGHRIADIAEEHAPTGSGVTAFCRSSLWAAPDVAAGARCATTGPLATSSHRRMLHRARCGRPFVACARVAGALAHRLGFAAVGSRQRDNGRRRARPGPGPGPAAEQERVARVRHVELWPGARGGPGRTVVPQNQHVQPRRRSREPWPQPACTSSCGHLARQAAPHRCVNRRLLIVLPHPHTSLVRRTSSPS